MTGLVWAGTVAGALIAVGTVLGWTLRRLLRLGLWAAAISALPASVEQLGGAVSALSTSVEQLGCRVDQLQDRQPA